MELVALLFIGFVLRGTWEHLKKDYRTSRDQRVKEVAKSYPKGALPKSRRRAATRQHALGWWTREVRHGFPVARTGWHAAWLAHKAQADAHHVRREEARADAAEAEVSRRYGVSGARQRLAAAQRELDKIEAELAAQRAKGSQATGRKAVQSAADEVAARRAKRQDTGGKCPGCGAPDGYPCLPGCDPSTASKAPEPEPATPTRRPDGQPGTETDRRFFDERESGYDGPLNQDGRRPDMNNPQEREAAETLARMRQRRENEPGPDAAGNPQPVSGSPASPPTTGGTQVAGGQDGGEADPVRSIYDPRYASAVRAARANGHPITRPTTGGTQVTADTNYTTVQTAAQGQAASAEQSAADIARQRAEAERIAEDMQAAEVDGATLSAQMDHVDRLRQAEQALSGIPESATVVTGGLQQRHGGLHEAHQEAPVRGAKREFYEE